MGFRWLRSEKKQIWHVKAASSMLLFGLVTSVVSKEALKFRQVRCHDAS